jgi:hypothetical protein
MSKFENFNSEEFKLVKEVFETIPFMDVNIAHIIEVLYGEGILR